MGAARSHLHRNRLRLEFGWQFEFGRGVFDERIQRGRLVGRDGELQDVRRLRLHVPRWVVELPFGRKLWDIDDEVQQLQVGGKLEQLGIEQQQRR